MLEVVRSSFSTMRCLAPLARALWLALLLPALLAPSGWQWHVCFCEQMNTAASEERSCCEEEPLEEGCCDEDPMTGGHECGECHIVSAGVDALACFGVPSVPLALPSRVLVIVARPHEREARPTGVTIARSHAPPGLRGHLPLRI